MIWRSRSACWVRAAQGHLRTKLVACQASIVGLLLLHQRTRRARRSAGKECANNGPEQVQQGAFTEANELLLDQFISAGDQRSRDRGSEPVRARGRSSERN